MTTESQPGLWRYAAGTVLVAAGAAAFVWGLIASLTGMTDAVAELTAPGSAETRLEPGVYTVFYEFDRGDSLVRAEPSAAPDALGALQLSVFGPEGSTVDVVRTGGHSRYAHGARTGYDAFRFEVPAAGPYRLRAKYPAHADGPSVALRVTDWSSATLWCGIVLTGGGAVLLTVPGVLLIALTHRARHPAAEGPAMTRGTLMETAPRSGYLGWRVVPGRWGFSLWAAATLAVAAVAFSAEGVVRPVALPLAATSGGLLAVFGAMAWRMGRLRASVPPGVHIAGDVMYVTGASRTPAAAWLELDTLTVRPLIGRARREDLHGAAVREADRFGGKVMPRGGRFFVVTPPGGRPFALGVTDPETWRPYLAGRAN